MPNLHFNVPKPLGRTYGTLSEASRENYKLPDPHCGDISRLSIYPLGVNEIEFYDGWNKIGLPRGKIVEESQVLLDACIPRGKLVIVRERYAKGLIHAQITSIFGTNYTGTIKYDLYGNVFSTFKTDRDKGISNGYMVLKAGKKAERQFIRFEDLVRKILLDNYDALGPLANEIPRIRKGPVKISHRQSKMHR